MTTDVPTGWEPLQEQSPPVAAPGRVLVTLRLVLVALWLFAAVAGYALHERPATLQHLYAAAAAGDVTSVRIVGGLGPEADQESDFQGSAEQAVHWRDGSAPRVTLLTVERPRDETGTTSDRQVTSDDVAAELVARDPDLRVDQTQFTSGFSYTPTIFGWTVPTWVGSVMFAVDVAAFFILIAGPQPWRATRWAWFWLLGPVFGSPLFLLLSGPTPGLPAPANPGRRLRGGWAFILTTVLGIAVPALVS